MSHACNLKRKAVHITCSSRHAALILAPPPPRDLTAGLMHKLAREARDTHDLEGKCNSFACWFGGGMMKCGGCCSTCVKTKVLI